MIASASAMAARVRKLCAQGQLSQALHMLKLKAKQGAEIPLKAFVLLSRECGERRSLAEGKQVHELVDQSRHSSNVFLANNLVDMYSKCGSAADAYKVFTRMSERDVVSWNTMISAYAASGRCAEAIALFQQMQATGIAPSKVTLVVALRACSRIAALERGKELHSLALERGFGSDSIVQNSLINMYAKCRHVDNAREVFDSMSARDVVSWNAMIQGYAQNGLGKEALDLFEQMKQEGLQPNKVTVIVALKACASITALEQGKQLHNLTLDLGYESDLIVCSCLIDLYTKCGCLDIARKLFNSMCVRDVATWNGLMQGYVRNGLCVDALTLYEHMEREGVQPNIVTFVVALKACAGIQAVEQGKQLHLLIVRRGFESDIVVQSALLDMYAKCGCMGKAQNLFETMNKGDVVGWTTMIQGYAQCGLGKQALALFGEMQLEGVQPTKITLIAALKACSSMQDLEQGRQLHSLIRKRGFELDDIVQRTLIDMYAECGCLEDAHGLFNSMNYRNVISWSAMIQGYVQNGHGKEALSLYEQMKQENVTPNKITLVIVLKACASIAALEQGKQLHKEIRKKGFESDVIVQSGLVDMYAKCGCLADALEVFNSMSVRNVVSWNAMIQGYVQYGLGSEVLAFYEQMKQEGVRPDGVTYNCILSACSHSGLVDEGCRVFDSMCKTYGITPTLEHYACMVDLLCRSGCLADAEDFIVKMPIQPDKTLWMSLLGAARNYGHVEIGRRAFDCVMKLGHENAAPYLLLSDIYAAAGRMDEVAKIRKAMNGKGF